MITLHIERLILEGLPILQSQAPLLQASLEAELTRLFQTRQPSRLASAPAMPLSSGLVHRRHDTSPAQLGRQIAQAVYQSLDNFHRTEVEDRASKSGLPRKTGSLPRGQINSRL